MIQVLCLLISMPLLSRPAAAQSDQEIVRFCTNRHGFDNAVIDCIGYYVARRQAGPNGRIAWDCTQRYGAGQEAMYCIVQSQAGPEARLAMDCVQRNGGFNQQTGVCIAFGTMVKELNPEGQMVAQCVAQYGVSKVAAACAATRLTVAEFDKCKNGIGTANGCFGPNNDLRRHIEGAYAAARREANPVEGAIRFGTGISVGDIRRHGPLGGENSEARKACNAVAGVFGGRC